MRNRTSLILFFLFVTVFPECISGKVVAGAGRFEQYLPFIQGKRVGMVVNHTSVVGTGQTHLLDTLLKQHINVVKVFAPEHGFRGNCERRQRFPHRSQYRLSLWKQQKADCRPTERHRRYFIRYSGCGSTFLYLYQHNVLRNGSLCRKQ